MAGPCQELVMDAEVQWETESYKWQALQTVEAETGRLSRRTGKTQESMDQGTGLGKVGQPALGYLVTVDSG